MRAGRVALLTSLLCPLTLADVKITSPAAGASVAAGTITVTWEDSGSGTPLSDLQSYTLQLLVGGNNPDGNAKALTAVQGQFAAGNSMALPVDPGLAGLAANGFYIKMLSVAQEGGTVSNFSPRFSLTGMTGTTDPAILAAVTALNGATAGPPTQNNVAGNAAAAPGAAGAGSGIPYNLQTGLTKYAPMMPIPSTKITATSFAPLFPTSAYVKAIKPLPPATILNTVTASQTFSVSSRENPATPAAHPNADMAKFWLVGKIEEGLAFQRQT